VVADLDRDQQDVFGNKHDLIVGEHLNNSENGSDQTSSSRFQPASQHTVGFGSALRFIRRYGERLSIFN
jgi:hypothetical protein